MAKARAETDADADLETQPLDDAAEDTGAKGREDDAPEHDGEVDLDARAAIDEALDGDHDETEEDEDPAAPAKKPDADDEEDEEGEPTEDGEAAAAPEEDEDPYAMPAELSKPGKEKQAKRWQQLVEHGKENARQVQAFRKVLETSGANKEEFAELITFSSQLKSGRRDDLREAYQTLKRYEKMIANLIGEDTGDPDQLADFPDLQKAVEDMDMGKAEALELASLRREQRARVAAEQAQRQQQETAQEAHTRWLQERDQAAAAIDQLDKRWAASDPYYTRIVQHMKSNVVPYIIEKYPPALWAEMTQQSYEQLRTGRAMADSGRGRPPGRTQQPLRSGSRTSGRGGSVSEAIANAKSPREAIDAALDGFD